MFQYRRLYALFVSFLLGILIFNSGGWNVLAAPKFLTTTTPTSTPTLKPEEGAEPQAWLDAALDTEKISPHETLVIHFNTPMDAESTLTPLLAWPGVDGISRWDESHTTLTFKPATALKSQSTYTFFLDSGLRSQSGKALKNASEWQVLTSRGVEISQVQPPAGELDRRYREVSVTFSQEMEPNVDAGRVSIEPAIPFKLNWQSARLLKIQLDQPFDFGQRYRLTLRGGLLAKDGAVMEEDFVWFYQQPPAQAQVVSITADEVSVTFNYRLNRQKTGLGFSVSPELEGEWRWVSNQQVTFKSAAPILANQIYSLETPASTVDINGFELSLPALQFSGLPPIHLLEQEDGVRRTTYRADSYFYAGTNLSEIQIQFENAVDHAAAEKAFSIVPALTGTFHWNTDQQKRDVLVYKLQELLKTGQQYTIRVDTSVTDLQGKPITMSPFQEILYVEEWGYRDTTFGQEGANIQVVDADGPRRIQLKAGKEAVFTAYRFELIDFVRLYAGYDSFQWYNRKNIQNIPVSGHSGPPVVWSGVSERKDKEDYYTIIETTLPEAMEPGLYVLNLSEEGRLFDQLFVVVSRNTLTVKQGDRKMQVWVTNINGQPVKNAEIRVYNARGEKIREGQSDETISMPCLYKRTTNRCWLPRARKNRGM